MLRKIFIIEKNAFDSEAGTFIGYVYYQNPQSADIMLYDGSHISAYYGTVDDCGQFYHLCMNLNQCGIHCNGLGLPPGIACYHNNIALSRAGYYINV